MTDEHGKIHTDGSRSGGQPVTNDKSAVRESKEPIGIKNGRLMAQHDCYTLESNPHRAGTKAYADFVTAFAAVRTERLCNELDITNADHIALWLERNMEPSAISYLAVQIVEAHEAALRQPVTTEMVNCARIAWRDKANSAVNGTINMTEQRTLNLPIPNGKTPMLVQCGSDECSHIWVAVWLPMSSNTACHVIKGARCPLCGNGQVYFPSTAQMEAAGLATA